MDSFPFTLNMAVDNLVKNEFDIYRREKKPHPLFKEIGIDAVPFNHPNMDKWRNNFQGAYFDDDEKGYSFGGCICLQLHQPHVHRGSEYFAKSGNGL